MNSEFKDYLNEQLQKNGLYIDDHQLNKIIKYRELILSWNKKMNLTRITEEKDFIEKHVIDSLMIIKHINIMNESKIVDIGTGAGIPGIIIKIARPDVKMILLEAIRKKANFLYEAVSRLELKSVEIVNERAETAAKNLKYRQTQDVAIARAVSSLRVLAEICLPFVKKGGMFIAMKGEKTETEIEEAQNSIKTMGGKISEVIEYAAGDAKHKLVIIGKIDNTPEKYPRRPGIPEKNPL
ncbi:MAG: rRNA (guanine527-N7)-methyltransferase [Tepidanaerobacteraceae bacterium]|nr:rRNA (guanine527-N7)-methyltransferase [Tepidanaerobacteraceae bacterium]